jgi:hypothetical protein
MRSITVPSRTSTTSTTTPRARPGAPARRPRALAGRAAVLLATALGVVAVAGPAVAPPAATAASTCAKAKPKGAEVIRLGRGLGCAKGAQLAGRTVRGDGYYQDSRYACRWGQGGTRTVVVGGRKYVPGSCFRKSDEREVEFLARRR